MKRPAIKLWGIMNPADDECENYDFLLPDWVDFLRTTTRWLWNPWDQKALHGICDAEDGGRTMCEWYRWLSEESDRHLNRTIQEIRDISDQASRDRNGA